MIFFSTGSYAMSSLRTHTDNECAQRQLDLHHNRAKSCKHGLW
ncbi:hypothetical protein GQ600_23875 [Phytophthora cactorum]|nr:hypothetical protein GQ600_23875 [Phytophthora cactorum]